MIECFKRGLIWRGIKHDLSKFLPSEFFPYARHFFGSNIPKRESSGYYKPYETGNSEFDIAWLKHANRNSHHWQYWTMLKDGNDNSFTNYIAYEIPYKDVLEMMCDWLGASKAQRTKGIKNWYLLNKQKLILHGKTRKFIEDFLYKLS
jgi:hypothetical protein